MHHTVFSTKDGSTDENAGGGDGGGRVEVVTIFVRRDKNGKISNEYIRGTVQVGREARLRWYGHLRRKDDGYIGRRMRRMELPGNREGLK